ncbi:MAG: putative ABC transporter permease [Ruminococcus sp.]|jgi:hypothetical protein
MKKIQNLIIKYTSLFVFCGLSYVGLELLFRHTSDYTMFILAGLCGTLFLSILNNFYTYDTDYVFQVIICGTMCTLSEWICGKLVNFDYHIWDYRNLPFSSPDGQINLFFALAWYLICALFIPLLDYIEWKVFHYKEEIAPYYVIFGKKYTPFDEN